jgi:hypothetical protein
MTTHTVESLMALSDAYDEFGRRVHRNKLESSLREALRDEYNRGVEAADKKVKAITGVGFGDAILALKEQTP